MSMPKVRVHHPNGIQGIEKAIAIQAVKPFCDRNGLSVEKLDRQIYDVYDNMALFLAPSNLKPDGLRNDMASRPIPVLILEKKNDALEIRQTEHTEKYLR